MSTITVLGADIGGTKSLFALFKVTLQPLSCESLFKKEYPSNSKESLEALTKCFLAELKEHHLPTPISACFGVAGPVIENSVTISNLPWPKETESNLSQVLGGIDVIFINDFQAVGWGIPAVHQDQLYDLHTSDTADNRGLIAYIGAGTGLGVGFCHAGEVLPSEGGHTTFAPKDDLELAYVSHLKETTGFGPHASYERVVSGTGMTQLATFSESRQGLDVPQMGEFLKSELAKGTSYPLALSLAATHHADPFALRMWEIFFFHYGEAASNLAVMLLPDAVYLAGGIASKNIPLIEEKGMKRHFLEGYQSKGRMSPIPGRTPIYLVRDTEVGLLGAAICAASKAVK